MSTELPPAGWYGDPAGPGSLRYWDGGAWTEHRAPVPAGQGPTTARGTPTGKQLLRVSLALFRQNRQMIWLPVLSGVMAALAFLIVSGAIAEPLTRAWCSPPMNRSRAAPSTSGERCGWRGLGSGPL